MTDLNIMVSPTLRRIVEIGNSSISPGTISNLDSRLVSTGYNLQSEINILSGNSNPNIYVGNILFVDSIYGNDNTAIKYLQNKPYKTLTAAKNIAISGDLIKVGPGIYNEENICKSNVSIYFENGAKIFYTGTGQSIISDRDGPLINNSIKGYGVFIYSGSGSNGLGNESGPLILRNPLSNFYIEGTSLSNLSRFGNANWGIWTENCKVNCFFDEITLGDNSYGVGWKEGILSVSSSIISGGALGAIGYGLGNSGDMYIQSNYIVSNSSAVPTVSCDGMGEFATIWVNSQKIENLHEDGYVIDLIGGVGKLYINSNKLFGSYILRTNVNGGSTWITSQKATSKKTNILEHYGGNLYLESQQYEILGSNNFYLPNVFVFYNDNGNTFARVINGNLKYEGIENLIGIYYGGGDVIIENFKINFSNSNINTNPIFLSENNLVLSNCLLIAQNQTNCITSSDNKNIKIYGQCVSNTQPDLNINILIGSLLVNSDA